MLLSSICILRYIDQHMTLLRYYLFPSCLNQTLNHLNSLFPLPYLYYQSTKISPVTTTPVKNDKHDLHIAISIEYFPLIMLLYNSLTFCSNERSLPLENHFFSFHHIIFMLFPLCHEFSSLLFISFPFSLLI